MKFGQYELLEPIAIGGMAEVFKGRVVAAEGFEKYVAIKRILPDLAADERFVKMLLTEARIHSALSHRNIVQIHDLGISERGEYFIVLEYVEGYDLRIITEQLTAEKEIIPEALSLFIAAEVAEGLHFAHELRGPDGQPLGLVHRDVTPSNVLISFAGEVKLSDFGLAKRRHDHSVVGSLKGNLVYMSPEQAKQAPLDRRTDIYSLGALLFELLTGRRLREITDEIAGWSQVASGVVPSARRLRPDLPAPIERLLDVALAADPANRYPDAAAFGAAIRDALAKLNVAVGASDLAALLSVVSPPKRARNIMLEPSKVIRLGSEAQALREAIAAPVTPAPVVSPGLTPASLRALDRPVRFRDPAATPMVEVHPPADSRDPRATPAPNAPPARTRGQTPNVQADPAAGANRAGGDRSRARAATPTPPPGAPDRARARATTPPLGDRSAAPSPRPSRGSGPTQPLGPMRATLPGEPMGSRGPLFRTPSYGVKRPSDQLAAVGPTGTQVGPAPPAAGGPAGNPKTPAPPSGAQQVSHPQRTPYPPQPQQVAHPQRTPYPPQPQQVAHPQRTPYPPQPQQVAHPQRTPYPPQPQQVAHPQRTPYPPQQVSHPQRTPYPPQPQQVAHPQRTPYPPGAPRRSSANLPAFNMPRDPLRETARVQLRSSSGWGRKLLVLLVLLGGAAAGTHFYVMPLEVLAVWRNPATLSIATDPGGATVLLDGAPLSRATPATVTVHRDRSEHVIDASHPGYRPARQMVRYDRSVGLSYILRLEKDPAAAPPPAPAAADGGAAPAAGDGETAPAAR